MGRVAAYAAATLRAMPSATYSHSTTTDATVDEAWLALQQPALWAQLAGVSEVSDTAFLGDGTLQSFRFVVAVAGQKYQGEAANIRHTVNEEIALRVDSSEMEGTLSVALQPSTRSTELTVNIALTPKSFLATIFFPAISSAVGSGMAELVDRLALEMV